MSPTDGGLRLPKRHFNALDLSRLIAAVAVLFWHYLHFTIPTDADVAPAGYRAVEPLRPAFALLYDYGHFAVQYFWIVSGFVFAHVYLDQAHAGTRFWRARFARLWPLHLLTLALVALLQTAYAAQHGRWFVYGPNDGYHFALNIFLAHFWGFERGMTFNGPSWSLSVEILAYLAFWMLLPALRQYGVAVAAGVGGLALLVLAGFEHSVPTCIFYFFGGVIAYFFMLRTWDRPPWLAAAAAIGFALAWRFDSADGFEFPQGGLWVGALFAVALLADRLDTRDRMAFGKLLGDASYGVYLWHFPLQLAAVMILDTLPGGRGLALNWIGLLGFIGGTVAIGFASHRWFERPAQRAILQYRLAPSIRAAS